MLSTIPKAQECPYAPELLPLSIHSDRRDVQRRFIGPLYAIAAINGIEHVISYEPRVVDKTRERLSQNIDTFEYKTYDPIAHDITNTMYDLKQELLRGSRFLFNDYTDHRRGGGYFTKIQKRLIKQFIYVGVPVTRLREGFESQINASFHLALPGYLIARYGLGSAPAIAERFKEMGLSGVAAVMREPDFVNSLSRLALTANGLHRTSNALYTTSPRGNPALSVGSGLGKNRQLVDTNYHGEVPQDLGVFELYEKKVDGRIGLSPAATKALSYYIRIRNSLDSTVKFADVDGYSRGCPVVQEAVYLRQDDLTDLQWQHLTGGDNPIAVYDEGTKRLVFKRFVFREMNKLLTSVISPVES